MLGLRVLPTLPGLPHRPEPPRRPAQRQAHLHPPLLVHVVRGGRADVPVAEVLAGRLDAEGRRDDRAALLAQRVDGLALPDALAL